VLVITDEGEQLGTLPLAKALELARERGLDLVEVAPNEKPPVCRLLDYGKLRYLHSKRDREAKKGQKNTTLREVRFRPNIGTHDFSSKVRKVKELIDDGSKVKVAVLFRGRELSRTQIGIPLLKRVADELQDDARLEKPPGMEGRSMSIVLIPGARRAEPKATGVKDAQAQDA
jgi:translation initiation factor IF-3